MPSKTSQDSELDGSFIANLYSALMLLGVAGTDPANAVRKAREFFNGQSLYENLVKLSAAITALHAYKLSIMRSEDAAEIFEEADAEGTFLLTAEVNQQLEDNKAYNEDLEANLAAQAFALCKVLSEQANEQMQQALIQAVISDRKLKTFPEAEAERLNSLKPGSMPTAYQGFDGPTADVEHTEIEQDQAAIARRDLAITWIIANLPEVVLGLQQGKTVTLNETDSARLAEELGYMVWPNDSAFVVTPEDFAKAGK